MVIADFNAGTILAKKLDFDSAAETRRFVFWFFILNQDAADRNNISYALDDWLS